MLHYYRTFSRGVRELDQLWTEEMRWIQAVQLIVCGSGYWGHRPEITESCTQPTRVQVNLINGQTQSARLSSIYTLSDFRDSNTKIVERR